MKSRIISSQVTKDQCFQPSFQLLFGPNTKIHLFSTVPKNRKDVYGSLNLLSLLKSAQTEIRRLQTETTGTPEHRLYTQPYQTSTTNTYISKCNQFLTRMNTRRFPICIYVMKLKKLIPSFAKRSLFHNSCTKINQRKIYLFVYYLTSHLAANQDASFHNIESTKYNKYKRLN